MESLIPFLKNSTLVDWFFIILVIFIAVVLIPIGIWMVIASRRRKTIYILMVLAFLPLLLALLGTWLRIRNIERLLARYPDANVELVAAVHQEAWIMTYIGAVGTLVPALIGVTGLALKNNRLN